MKILKIKNEKSKMKSQNLKPAIHNPQSAIFGGKLCIEILS
jgi:hypothetical protein